MSPPTPNPEDRARSARTAALPTWLARRVEEHGPRDAVVAPGGRLSYVEASARSARWARTLVSGGVGKGTRVGVLLPNGPEWVLAWLAAARIGALVVPINTFFKTRELGWMLRHADIDTLICSGRLLDDDPLARLEELAPGLRTSRAGALRSPELPALRRVFAWDAGERPWVDPARMLDAGPEDVDEALLRALESEVVAADPMVVLYSSGSTGDPKGAVHSHGNVLRQAARLARLRELRSDDRVWSPMPFFWVGGLVFSLASGLDVGACLLVQERFDPGETLAFLESERATVAIGWPHFGKALAEHPDRPRRDLSALRAGNLPGLLPAEICPDDPELRPNGLGMTETCGPHTYTGEEPLSEARRGVFGPALPGVEHRIVDPETGAELAPGQRGEICVRGGSLMQGLYKRESADVFEPDGFYRTGDAGFFDAKGELRFEGRLGEMIKSAGANVTPSEVESALMALAEVEAAYVVGVSHAERGESVAAAVVLVPGVEASSDSLRQQLRGEIAVYKVPRHLWLTRSDALPFRDTGKIDKQALHAMLEARVGAGEI